MPRQVVGHMAASWTCMPRNLQPTNLQTCFYTFNISIGMLIFAFLVHRLQIGRWILPTASTQAQLSFGNNKYRLYLQYGSINSLSKSSSIACSRCRGALNAPLLPAYLLMHATYTRTVPTSCDY